MIFTRYLQLGSFAYDYVSIVFCYEGGILMPVTVPGEVQGKLFMT